MVRILGICSAGKEAMPKECKLQKWKTLSFAQLRRFFVEEFNDRKHK